MKTFYFVRQPDHMVDYCCDQTAHLVDIDTIKKKHKIFYTRKEAEEYQKSFVIYPKEVADQKNLDFIRNGLCKAYGYKPKESKREQNNQSKQLKNARPTFLDKVKQSIKTIKEIWEI